MIIHITDQPITQLDCPTLILHLFEERRPPRGATGTVDWLLNGFLSRFLKRGHLSGRKGEVVLLPSNGRLISSKILILGLGSPCKFSTSDLKNTWREAGNLLVNLKLSHLGIAIPPHSNKLTYPDGNDLAEAMVGGLLEGIKAQGGESMGFQLFLTNFDELKTKENKNAFRQKISSFPGIQSIGF